MSSFGHTALVNSRALQLAGLDARRLILWAARSAGSLGRPVGNARGRRAGSRGQADSGADARRERQGGGGRAGRAAQTRRDDVLGCGGGAALARSLCHRAARGFADGARALRRADHPAAGPRSRSRPLRWSRRWRSATTKARSSRARAHGAQRETVSRWRDHRAGVHGRHVGALLEPAGRAAPIPIGRPRRAADRRCISRHPCSARC